MMDTHELVVQAQQRLAHLKAVEAHEIRRECCQLLDSLPDTALEDLRESLTTIRDHHKPYRAAKFISAWEWGTYYRVLSILVGYEVGIVSSEPFEDDE